LAGLLVVVVIIAIAVALSLPSNDTTTTTTTPSTVAAPGGAQSTTTTTASPAGTGAAAAVAACRSDVSALSTALAAYQATNGSYPTPPADWTAATYATNFAPLTDATPPGPFLKMPPADTKYVILWDRTGRIWVEAPGTFTPTYDPTNDGNDPSSCTRVAR
jgi:hypothetical protein